MASRPVPQKLSRHDLGIIIIMLSATFVVILNETIMNVALPRLMTELNVSANTVQWLATAFMLTMAVVIPITGYIIQRFRTRTVFLAAMSLFCLGTLIAALAPGFVVLLLGRIVQASGTALMMPLLMSTILTLVPVRQRGIMMGNISIVISVAPAVGPTISGFIIQNLSWRYMFWFVLPIALLALAYGALQLKDLSRDGKVTPLDALSIGFSAFGFGGLVYGFSRAGEHVGAWGSPQVIAALVVGALGLLLFVLRQLALQKRNAPLLDLRTFSYPMFSLGMVLMGIIMMALFATVILLPIYLQNVRGLSASATGLLLLPGGVMMGVMAPFVGRLFDRYGPVYLSVIGGALLSLVMWRFTALSASTPVGVLLGLHISFSLALALLFTPVMTTALNPLPPQLYAHGSAIMSTLQQVSGAVGTALLITVMTTRVGSSLAQGLSEDAAQLAGMHAAFAAACALAILGLVLTFFLRQVEPADVPAERGPEDGPELARAAVH